MTLTSQEREAHQRDLKGLPELEIKRRLDGHIWRGEKRIMAEQHLETLEMDRRDRFGAKDRQIQLWILRVAIIGVAVGIAGVVLTAVLAR